MRLSRRKRTSRRTLIPKADSPFAHAYRRKTSPNLLASPTPQSKDDPQSEREAVAAARVFPEASGVAQEAAHALAEFRAHA